MSADRVRARTASLIAGIAAIIFTPLAGSAWADRYSDAVAHRGRSAQDIQRDTIDHPAEVLRLAGIRPGMEVADFLAAGGYYSELLGYIVGPRGHVYLLNNEAYDKWSDNQWQERLVGGRLPNVEHRTITVEHLGCRRARSMRSCSSRCTTISTGNPTTGRGRRSIRMRCSTRSRA